MTRLTRVFAALCIASMSALPVSASAQIRASELGSVSQVVDGTKITLTYSRPRTRNRPRIFGTNAAHWGETWTPGANWATTLENNKDITLNGTTLPKGKYSVWMVLRESGDWTTVFDPDFHRYHMEPPDSNKTQIRIATHVEVTPFVDVLTWSFPELTVSGGTLAMQWSTTKATMKFAVQPSLTVPMSAADAAPYLGRYTIKADDLGDTTKAHFMILTHESGIMKGQFEPNDPYFQKFAMIRVGPDIFVPGLYDKQGAIYEVLRPDMVFTFTRANGKVSTFEIRDDADSVVGKGKRIN